MATIISPEAFIEEFEERRENAAIPSCIQVDLTPGKIPNAIVLDRIENTSDKARGNGHSKRALNILVSLADEHSYSIKLTVHGLNEITDEERLAKWYLGEGFVCDEPSENGERALIRSPKLKR